MIHTLRHGKTHITTWKDTHYERKVPTMTHIMQGTKLTFILLRPCDFPLNFRNLVQDTHG